MNRALAFLLNFRTAYSGYAGIVCFFLLHGHSGQCQTNDTSAFSVQYQKLLSLDENTDPALVDTLVLYLRYLNQQHAGKYDSLVISALNWQYQRNAQQLSPAACLRLLHVDESNIRGLTHTVPVEMARFYSQYIHLFWINYETDSIAFYLDEMERQLDNIREPVAIRIGWLYEKGRLAISQGDYDASLIFLQRGLEYLTKNFPKELRFKYLIMNAMGITYRRLGKVDEAIDWYEEILSQSEDEVEIVKMKGAILNNLGLAYKDCGEWESAIARLTDAIEYYKKTFSPTYPDIGSGYDNIAICYQSDGRVELALQYSYKSIDFITRNLGPSHPDLLLPMNSITWFYLLQGKLQAALSMNRKAQHLLQSLGWNPDNPEGNYYLSDGFDVFAYAVEIQRALFESTTDTIYLRAGIQSGAWFMAMTDYAYDNLKNDLSKEIFQKKHAGTFSACIRDLFTLYELTRDSALLETAFSYSEKFKALELLYAAQKDKADHIERFKVLNRFYAAQMDSIRQYEALYYSSVNDSVLHREYYSKLNGCKEDLYLWKEKIRREHPNYYQLIYHPEPVSIKALQQALAGTDQSILAYHLSEGVVYFFVITADKVHWVRKIFDFDMTELIASFRSSIYGYFTDTSRSESRYASLSKEFVEDGTRLYSILIAPVERFLANRVIVIVDKSLGYVPFDLLLRDKPEVAYRFRDHHYLLHNHALSYSYSARFWMDMESRPFETGFSMLAMAPDFPETGQGPSSLKGLRSGFTKLYYNEKEVREINRIIPGRILSGQQATKKNFINFCSHYPILHLATHSTANDDRGDYSFLAFSDDGDSRLLASEIYNLNLSSALVTLSACETGLGELQYGEGIISLARAFSFAGAKSIVSSLWSVNDKSTPAVMTAFYQYSKAGYSIDIALQKAKLDYLASRGHADAHPFYWGGFIAVGDMRPLIPSSLPSWCLISIIGLSTLIGIMILFFFLKRVKKPGTSGS